jgi:hypothetical protein
VPIFSHPERHGKIERHQVEARRKKGWWEAERWLVTILSRWRGRPRSKARRHVWFLGPGERQCNRMTC